MLRRAALGATALTCVLPAAAGAATVTGNVASWVASAAKTGTAPATQTVDIAVHMALKNTDGLTAFVTAVSTPGNSQYGHYLTKSQFAAAYAPDAADVAAVKTLLTKAGMTGVTVGPAGAYVSATATVAQLRKTFGVTQNIYSYGATTLRANKEAPTIPAALAGKVLFIEGLDDTDILRQPQHVSITEGARVAPTAAASGVTAQVAGQAATPTVTPPPVAAGNPLSYCDHYAGDLVATLSTRPTPYAKKIPWAFCGYTPQQLQAAYGLNPGNIGIDGTGVTVAIVDAFASPTLKGDGNRYAANHGLPKLTTANFSQILTAGAYNVPANQVTNAYGWWGEESLDLAAVHGAAPGANIVYVGGKDNGAGLTTAFTNTVYNHVADIITNSYSYGGDADSAADIAAQDQTFMAADAQGITLLFSSGDDGDVSQNNGVATGEFESDSPYVTGVGGTSLLLADAKGTKTEYGWGNYRAALTGVTVNSATSITDSGVATATLGGVTYDAYTFYSGSGGGISLVEPQPDYQAPVVSAALATTLNEAAGGQVPLGTPHRVAPDISAIADPYTGYLYGESFTIAGNAIADSGCTKLTATTEYCEDSIGGTSLASPVMAGVMATVDQVRGYTGRPYVGFANPFLYSIKTGTKTNSAAINQIVPPTTPLAVLRGYQSAPTTVRIVTINSVPKVYTTAPFTLEVCAKTICEGLDDVFNYTAPGYNDVTGLGVPYVPLLAIQ